MKAVQHTQTENPKKNPTIVSKINLHFIEERTPRGGRRNPGVRTLVTEQHLHLGFGALYTATTSLDQHEIAVEPFAQICRMCSHKCRSNYKCRQIYCQGAAPDGMDRYAARKTGSRRRRRQQRQQQPNL